jgi:hypothetical protein
MEQSLSTRGYAVIIFGVVVFAALLYLLFLQFG